MKRNMELVRQILQQTEVKPLVKKYATAFVELETPDYSPEEVKYHVRMLHEGGLIVGQNLCAFAPGDPWVPQWLTWQGHDFLDSIREEAVWSKVKSRLASFGTSVPLEIVKALAVSAIKEILKLP